MAAVPINRDRCANASPLRHGYGYFQISRHVDLWQCRLLDSARLWRDAFAARNMT